METFGKTFPETQAGKKKEKEKIASRYLVVYNLNTSSSPLSTIFIKKIFIREAFVSLLFEKKRWRGLLVKSSEKEA